MRGWRDYRDYTETTDFMSVVLHLQPTRREPTLRRAGQYHLAVAGGCEALTDSGLNVGFAPTRYREVVLTSFRYERANKSTCLCS